MGRRYVEASVTLSSRTERMLRRTSAQRLSVPSSAWVATTSSSANSTWRADRTKGHHWARNRVRIGVGCRLRVRSCGCVAAVQISVNGGRGHRESIWGRSGRESSRCHQVRERRLRQRAITVSVNHLGRTKSEVMRLGEPCTDTTPNQP